MSLVHIFKKKVDLKYVTVYPPQKKNKREWGKVEMCT